jgi:thiamine biosynthesis lipoprotein
MYNIFVQNFNHREAVSRLSLFLTALLIIGVLTSCAKTISADAFLFDTLVSVTSDEVTAERVLAELSMLSEEMAVCYEKRADELTSAAVLDMVAKTETLRMKFGNSVDLYIGALTKAWGISTSAPIVPTEEEIETLKQDRSFIDPGAVAKGYALDRVYEGLSGVDYAVVSMGSSVLLYGEKSGGKPFTTGIKSPDANGNSGFAGYVETGAAFISTSGGYERYFEADGVRYEHILDPLTGYPVVTDLASVTVIVPAEIEGGGLLSDFLSTLIYMSGISELERFLTDDSYTVLAIGENGNIYGNADLIPLTS